MPVKTKKQLEDELKDARNKIVKLKEEIKEREDDNMNYAYNLDQFRKENDGLRKEMETWKQREDFADEYLEIKTKVDSFFERVKNLDRTSSFTWHEINMMILQNFDVAF